ncbi:hypothetical protein ASPSYDRAFT_49762 [Aspergillus sydowii CBS 593.65]|uniref:Uncharacterized protein n=1 Tax=Aspergillus sydowii CBS 593.65 TaxID=1036612 RepID=A0A1L9T5K5_9EURO|nr:uncharacterized protein ASPSYDRAFT_49762 [Aspergillus sydowii CBS 593.65]OJJ54641.1 hypothetical protein ASPSYDRAFT_49762 [Aspergillus sydowii CBS 593.65]
MECSARTRDVDTYCAQNAIRLLESRKRPARPKTPALRAATDHEAPTNNQASVRGK